MSAQNQDSLYGKLGGSLSSAPEAANREAEDVAIARAYQLFHLLHAPDHSAVHDARCASVDASRGTGRLICDAHRFDSAEANRLAEPARAMPEAGSDFLGFRLIAELGRGAFGRVFLAQQGDLANRCVALKIGTDLFDESQALAQLQHTHIVPIYSVHRAGALQAVCMPYLGSTTLADLLGDLAGCGPLPASGKALVGTLHNRRNSTLRGSQASRLSSPASPDSKTPVARPEATPFLERLEHLSYVEAVLWIAARLAEGLAHAHERGIVHCDLKPANVLLTDDGAPMLLDFNLCASVKPREGTGPGTAAARLGGTLPYMAPEHLEAFSTGVGTVDARSDLYALGVVLYELLAGQRPFACHQGPAVLVLPHFLADHRTLPVPVHHRNRSVSPSVSAIVAHCLEPEPSRRYQSAQELREDLERHLANRPLRHAREPRRERARKWARRHQRLAACLLAGIAVAALSVPPTAWYVARERERTRSAHAARDHFADEVKAVRYLLFARGLSGTDRDEGTRRAQTLLDRYAILDDSAWRERPEVRYLPPRDQQTLGLDVQEVLLLLAGVERRQALAEVDPPRREQRLERAWDLNARAEAVEESTFSRYGWQQRAELARLLGREDARPLASRAAATELRTARDHVLLAAECQAQRRFRDALPLLQEAARLEPQNFWARYGEGACYFELGQDVEALACCNAALALWPDSHLFHFNRALVQQRRRRFEAALADFNEAIRLGPKGAEAAELYRARGGLLGRMGRHKEAVADLSQALDLDASRTDLYFLRATARKRAGDSDGSRQDLETGLRRRPVNAHGWTARGVARLEGDAHGALADFEEALKLEASYLEALQNKAHVLSDHLGQNAEALKVMDRAVALYPDFVPARLGRGVLRARLGQRASAHADARECLDCDNSPLTLYQVANVYALTSRQVRADRRRALPLLAAALQKGFGLDVVDQDPDFAPLRQDRDFRDLVDRAKGVQAVAARRLDKERREP